MISELDNSSWGYLLPDCNLQIDESNFHDFFRTMYERQKIYIKRNVLKEKAPWTEDKILRDYNFTNVYRELDRNSQWEIENIISNLTLSRKDLVWQICLFRLFNKIELFEFVRSSNVFNGNPIPLYEEFDANKLLNIVSKFRSTGQNPYTSSYYVNSTFGGGLDKDSAFCIKSAKTLHKLIPNILKKMLTSSSPKEIIEELERIPGVGSFMSHEFYISFCYAEKYWRGKLMKWDQNDYTNVGPGASMGIRLIFPNLKESEQEKAIYLLRDLAPAYMHENFLGFEFLNWNERIRKRYFSKSSHNLTLHQIEMWLCEYSKYWKMVNGVGKQRSKFRPRTS